MPIHISRVDEGFTASVTPSKYRDVTWSTDAPLERQVLIDRLVELGYHLQDIADAFHEADADWLSG